MKGMSRLGALPTFVAILWGFLFLSFRPVHGQLTNQILQPRGSWPGYARPDQGQSLQIANDKIYLAGGIGGLVVLDVNAGDKPQRVGSIDTRLFATAVHVVDGLAYVTDNAGLEIFDVSNAAQPTRLGVVGDAGPAVGVWVTNRIAFVGAWTSGLQVIDVGDPMNPKRIAGLPTEGNAAWLEVANGYAYVPISEAGLAIYDVGDPSAPRLVSTFETGGHAYSVDVVSNRAYVAAYESGLLILDVSDPAKPVELGRYSCNTAYRVQVVGRTAYVAAPWNGLLVLDVTNPSSPWLVAHRQVSGNAYDVKAIGDNAYVATDSNGLEVVSLSQGRTTIVDLMGWTHDLQVIGNLAYVADGGLGLQILDVSDSDKPRLLGSMPTPAAAEGIALSGHHAYLACGRAGVQVVDVSSPASPTLVRSVTLPDAARAIRVEGQRAFVAASGEGLVLLDISRPDAPSVLSSTRDFCIGGTAVNLQVQRNMVYLVGVDGAGFQIIDVSDAAAPRLVGGYLYGWPSFHYDGVCVSGNLAYLANEDDGVLILDISDPAKPSEIGVFDTAGATLAIEVLGSLAYVSDYANGLLVLDVADPRNPRLLEQLKTAGYALGFHAVAEKGYVAEAEWGVRVIDLRPRTPQQVHFQLAHDLVITELPLVLTATATSSLPVSFRVVSGPALVEGNQLTATGAGVVVVRAEQSGDAQFLPSFVDRTLIVSLPPQSIEWLSPASQYLELGKAHDLRAQASSGLPVNFRVQQGPASILGAAVTVTHAGTIRIVAEQPGDAAHAPASFTRTFNLAQFAPASGAMPSSGAVGRWPGVRRGEAVAVAVAGERAYVAGGSLRILDVSDPQKPVELGAYDGGAPSLAVHVATNVAYVALGNAGLSIVNVSDPSAPRKLGSIKGYAVDVVVRANLAYVAMGNSVQVYDIQDPASPVKVGAIGFTAQVESVRVVGDRLYVTANSAGLFIEDLEDARNPRLLGTVDTPGTATGMFAAGDLVYLADGNAGLQIIDTSNPANPAIVGNYHTSKPAQSVWVTGSLAYIADHSAGVQVVDVRSPSKPTYVGAYSTDSLCNAIQVQEGYGFVAESDGLTVIELGTGGSPRFAGSYTTYGNTKHIQALDGYLYVADSGAGLKILDRANPRNPVEISAYQTAGYADSVQVVGQVAYVASSGLEIVDLSQPESPKYLGGFYDCYAVSDFVVQDNRAFVAAYTYGFFILDVTDPSNVVTLANYEEDDEYPSLIAVQKDYAYLGTSHGVQVMDIHDPTRPVKVGYWQCQRGPSALAVAGQYAYVGTIDGLEIVDISDPTAPRREGKLAPRPIRGIEIRGDLLYLANLDAGIEIVDVTDPSNPRSVGTFATPANAAAITSADGLIYVACGEFGTEIFHLEQRWPQTISVLTPKQIFVDQSPALTATASSGLPVSFSIVRGPAVFEDERLVPSGVGDVVIRAMQSGNSNYVAATVEKTISVQLRPQAIAWRKPAQPVLSWNESHLLEATADSGLPVTFRLKSGPAMVEEGMVTMTNRGRVVVTAAQAGNAVYQSVEQDLVLNGPRVVARELGSWPGYIRGPVLNLSVLGNHLYAAAGRAGLVIYDIADLTNPVRLGGLTLEGASNEVQNVWIIQNVAYLATRSPGLRLVDVSNPTRPQELGAISLDGIVTAGEVYDGFAYFVRDASALCVLDVRDPLHPELVGSGEIAAEANAIAVHDGLGFVAAGIDGLAILDVHNPRQPYLLTQLSTGGTAIRTALAGSHVYVAQGYDGLAVIDVSDPGAPYQIGLYSEWVEDIAVAGPVGLAYSLGKVQALDLNDPTHPGALDSPSAASGISGGLHSIAGKGFIATTGNDLVFVDLARPKEVVKSPLDRLGGTAFDLSLDGGVVALADDSGGVRFIDVRDPTAPGLVASFNGVRSPRSITAANQLAYVGGYLGDINAISFSDSIQPALLGKIELSDFTARLYLAGNRVLAPQIGGGLQMIDASDPSQMSAQTAWQMGPRAFDVTMSGSVAVMGTAAGLRVMDVSEPVNPVEVGSLSTATNVYAVTASNGLVYAANGVDGLLVADLSDPRQPKRISQMATGGTGDGVELGDGVVYLSDGPAGLSVIEVSEPSAPAVVAKIPIAGQPKRVRAVDNCLYVAAGDAGLRILNIQLAWPQFITATLPDNLPLNGNPLRLDAVASSGLPISFTLVSGPGRLNGELLEPTGPGTILIQIDQAGDEHFLPTSIQQRIQIVGATAETLVSECFSANYPEVAAADRDLLADPDGDRVVNALECLLGSHPDARGRLDGRLPFGAIRSLEDQPVWEIVIEWNTELAGLIEWRIEVSGCLELGQWETIAGSDIELTPTGLVLRLPMSNQAQFVRLRLEDL